MRKSQPKRIWDDARLKVDTEGACRRCGRGFPLETAHVLGREHDWRYPVRLEEGWKPYTVHPDRIIPLCRPCHGAQHRHEFDTLPLLDPPEQLQAVADAGGIEQARVRLAPSCYRAELAA